LTQGEAIRNYYHDSHVIQDMLVPLYKVGEALEFVHREMEVRFQFLLHASLITRFVAIALCWNGHWFLLVW
jgi:hypothetical protein